MMEFWRLDEVLRSVFPHGHEGFTALALRELKLHSDKNHDYAAGGHPLGNFYRVAAILSLYPGLSLADPAVVAIVYCVKQLDAYLWMKSNKHQAKVEGLQERLQDISVYAKLIQLLEIEQQLEHHEQEKGQ
jgi:hypothetical protein